MYDELHLNSRVISSAAIIFAEPVVWKSLDSLALCASQMRGRGDGRSKNHVLAAAIGELHPQTSRSTSAFHEH